MSCILEGRGSHDPNRLGICVTNVLPSMRKAAVEVDTITLLQDTRLISHVDPEPSLKYQAKLLSLMRELPGARRLTRRIVGDSLRSQTEIARRDPKSELQERTQRGGGDTPVYEVLSVEGPEHDHLFEVEVRVGDDVLGRGRGRSKKLAEQEAATVALRELERRQDEAL